MGLIFSLFDVTSALCLPFVSHSSLLTVNLVVARDGFPSKWKLSVFFIVAILIAEVLFEQFLIRTKLNIADNEA